MTAIDRIDYSKLFKRARNTFMEALKEIDQKSSKQIAQEIFNLLDVYSNYLPSKIHELKTNRFSFLQILALVEKQQSIHFILPAFPAKSPNPQKTSGIVADLGEVIALQTLNALAQKIENIYEPGASICICSDGRVFSDLVMVPDSDVDAYRKTLLQIFDEYELKHLSYFSLDDCYPNLNNDQKRAVLLSEYGESIDSIRMKILSEDDEKNLFNGIHRFITEDHRVLLPMLSKNQISKQSKTCTYHVIQRSQAWSRLLEDRFSSSVRLSIHPQNEQSKKHGVRLIPTKDIWGTPWHNVLVLENNTYYLDKRINVEEKEATLCMEGNKYAYYKL